MSELEERLTQIIEEAIAIRFDFNVPTFDASVAGLYAATLDLTQRLTKLELLLSQAIRAKAATDRKAASVKLAHQAQWDAAISGKNRRPTFNDYSSSKEKIAEANLATFESQKIVNLAELNQSFASEAVDIARLHYYGLDKVRQDIQKRLAAVQSDYYSID